MFDISIERTNASKILCKGFFERMWKRIVLSEFNFKCIDFVIKIFDALVYTIEMLNASDFSILMSNALDFMIEFSLDWVLGWKFILDLPIRKISQI